MDSGWRGAKLGLRRTMRGVTAAMVERALLVPDIGKLLIGQQSRAKLLALDLDMIAVMFFLTMACHLSKHSSGRA